MTISIIVLFVWAVFGSIIAATMWANKYDNYYFDKRKMALLILIAGPFVWAFTAMLLIVEVVLKLAGLFSDLVHAISETLLRWLTW